MPNLHKLKRRGRRGRIPRPVHPSGIQLRYYAALKEMLAYAHALVRARLLPRLPELLDRASEARGDGIHTDALPPGRRVNTIMDGVAQAFVQKFSPARLEDLARGIARATSDFQQTQLFRQVNAAVGVDLSSMLTPNLTARVGQFVAENVALIKSVPQTYFSDIEQRVLAGMRAGARHEDIASELEDRLGVAESDAKLIARDQVLKFNGELNMVRQQALGVDRYIWRTVEDERVRIEHEDFDGNEYSWDDPPGDGSPREGTHPGSAINCRCYAEPVVDDILDSIDGAGDAGETVDEA